MQGAGVWIGRLLIAWAAEYVWFIMNLEYHFELVFLRLVLKRNVLSESKLRITLLQTSKQLQPASNAFQTEQVKIRKNQKIVDLQSMKAFSFNASHRQGDNAFVIKYEIKGNSEERVRSIPVHTAKMIAEFFKDKKNVFEESFGGENAEITYKFYINSKQPEFEVFNLLITPQPKEATEEGGNETKRSNSISRGKRPPNLNISKRTGSFSPPQEESSKDIKPTMKHFPSNSQGSFLVLSPVSPQPNKMPFLGLNNLESHEENSSVSGTHKKISSLPMSQIEKVNELMATHHRPQASGHHQPYLSYKLKIVIVMFIIGIAFLVIDTFSDRKSYNSPSQKDDHGHQRHDAAHESAHAKPHKTPKSKPSKQPTPPPKPSKPSNPSKKAAAKVSKPSKKQ